jgi:phosphomannomutase
MSSGAPADIYRGYDIRGRSGTDLTAPLMVAMGRAIASYVRGQGATRVYLGFDGRPSGHELVEAVASGLVDGGTDVIDLGIVPTPLVYFASSSDQGSFGVAVTASHLAAEWNGLKLCYGSRPVHSDVIRRAIESAAAAGPGPGSRTTGREAVLAAYGKMLGRIVEEIPAASRPSLVLDCQNAAASEVVAPLLEALGFRVSTIYTELGAPYPFGTPDPQVGDHLRDLVAAVRDRKADVGFAFDGDADRLGVVDETGRRVPPDAVLALLARDVLGRVPGAAVVFDVLSSPVVAETVRSAGGRPVEAPSGHAYVQDLVRDEAAPLGGESSGHLFFADDYRGDPAGYDDATYAAVRVLEYMGRSGSLGRRLDSLPPVVAGDEWRPHCPDGVKRQIVKEVEESFKAAGYRVSAVDGVKAHFGSLSWALVRAANTEPALSIRVVGPSKADVAQVESEIAALVRKVAARYDVTL